MVMQKISSFRKTKTGKTEFKSVVEGEIVDRLRLLASIIRSGINAQEAL